MNEFVLLIFPPLFTANEWLQNFVSLELILSVPIILLTVFIPMAIFMIEDNKIGFPWDKSVILTRVIIVKWLFVLMIFYFISALFWDVEVAKVALFIPVIMFCIGLLTSLYMAYRWIGVTEIPNLDNKNYRTLKRLELLDNLNDTEKDFVWSSTWSGEREMLSLFDQRELVNRFVAFVDKQKYQNKSTIVIVQSFTDNMSKINTNNPEVHETLMNFSLKWSNLQDNDWGEELDRSNYESWTVHLLLEKLMERDIGESFKSYLLFHDTTRFIQQNNIHETEFLKNFLSTFINTLERTEYPYTVWNDFPEDWTVTVEKLKDSSLVNNALAVLSVYMRFLTRRELLSMREDYKADRLLDDITKNILLKVDMQLWSDILAFQWSSWGSDEYETSEQGKVRSYIKRIKTFGHFGRSYGYWETDKTDYDELYKEKRANEIEETVQIVRITNIAQDFTNKATRNIILEIIENYDKDNLSEVELHNLSTLKNICDLFSEKVE